MGHPRRRRRARCGAALLLAILFILMGCSPRDDARFKREMASTFPSFRIVRLEYSESRGFPGEGGGANYYFDLESRDVPGFQLTCNYYLWSPDQPDQVKAFQQTIFTGKVISKEQLIEFERLWLSLDLPPVAVGRNSSTGPSFIGKSSVEKYRHIAEQDVYTFEAVHPYFFLLDPKTGHWSYLPGYWSN